MRRSPRQIVQGFAQVSLIVGAAYTSAEYITNYPISNFLKQEFNKQCVYMVNTRQALRCGVERARRTPVIAPQYDTNLTRDMG